MDIASILADVRHLVDDATKAEGTWAKDAYLLPKVSIAYRDVMNEMLSSEVPIDEETVEIPNIAAGTHDLSAYQAEGQPLERMTVPRSIRWKEAGSAPDQYMEVDKRDRVRDLQNEQVVRDWAFAGGRVELTPVTIAVDLEIVTEMLQVDLKNPEDKIAMAQLRNAIGYRTAFLIAVIRNNPGWKQAYPALYQENIDNVKSNLARSGQDVVRRFGRASRRRSPIGMPRLRNQ